MSESTSPGVKAVALILFPLAVGWWPQQQVPAVLTHECPSFVHYVREWPGGRSSQLHMQSRIQPSMNSLIFSIPMIVKTGCTSESLGDPLQFLEASALTYTY